MSESIIYNKALTFSLNVIPIYKQLVLDKEFVLSKQLLKAATSIGANVSEARYAQSTKDFISKMHIALKEANETVYWLDILQMSNYIDKITYNKLNLDVNEIKKILIQIIRTSKNNANV